MYDMTSEEDLKWLGVHESQEEETWLRALEFLRSRGEDPEQILKQATENLKNLRYVNINIEIDYDEIYRDSLSFL
jgi:hypothetical protein